MTTFGEWREACASVARNCNNEYAKAYAKAGINLLDGEAIGVQALYILNNIQHWRGDEAKRVRQVMKDVSKRYRRAS